MTSDDRLSPEPSRAQTLRRAWPLLLRPHRALLAAALATSLVAAALQLVVPVLLGVATDAVVDGDRHRLAVASGAAAAAAVASTVASLIARRVIAHTGEVFIATVRVTTVERLLARPLAFFDRHPTGELVARATTDVAALSSFVREWLPMLVGAALLLVATLTVLFVSAWQLALLTLLYLPGLALVAVRFRRVAGPAHAGLANARAHTSVIAQETLAARSWLQGIDACDERVRHTTRADQALLVASSRAVRADNRTSALHLLQQATLALVLLAGGLMAESGLVTLGTVATFVLALRQLYQPLDTLGIAYGAIEGARAELARIVEVVEGPPLPPHAPTIRSAARVGCGLPIELDDVWYSYDGTVHAAAGVNLRIGAGEHVALVGATGSGKSTVAKLLAGLYPPDRGRVRLDGRAVADWPHDLLRRTIVMLPQDVHLIDGTIAANMRLAPGDHSDEDLFAAIERSGLTAWLAALPNGLATTVGDKGARLSAGERQLVAIARAALLDPSVLILDEATADVDPASEQLLNDALDRSAARRTTVVVAHREATALRAGRRIVIGAGRVVNPPPRPDE